MFKKYNLNTNSINSINHDHAYVEVAPWNRVDPIEFKLRIKTSFHLLLTTFWHANALRRPRQKSRGMTARNPESGGAAAPMSSPTEAEESMDVMASPKCRRQNQQTPPFPVQGRASILANYSPFSHPNCKGLLESKAITCATNFHGASG